MSYHNERFEIHDLDSALNALQGRCRMSRRLYNHLYLVKRCEGDGIYSAEVKLYGNKIIHYFKDKIVVSHGGWGHSRLTRETITVLLPPSITCYSRGGVVYIGNLYGDRIVFKNPIMLRMYNNVWGISKKDIRANIARQKQEDKFIRTCLLPRNIVRSQAFKRLLTSNIIKPFLKESPCFSDTAT